MKTRIALFCLLLALTVPQLAVADWFLSVEVKTLIVKAESGDAEAQFQVGSAYDFGRGAPRDPKAALKWYRLAAEQNYAEAQNSLGSAFQAERQFSEAFQWYQKAASQHHALATNNLAYLYDLGLGITQSREKALELYTVAADLGSAEAMLNIAVMYGAGQLGEPDLFKACIWSARANKYAGQDRAIRTRVSALIPKFVREMSSEQLEACQHKADEWAPASGGAR